jgi:hypothetical protein
VSRLRLGWTDAFRRYRRALKAKLPWVRRSEHRRLEGRYLGLLGLLASPPPLATQARLHALKPLEGPLAGEACLFVTHATAPPLKPHVRSHLEHLLRAGFQVALVINTELAPNAVAIDPALLGRLRAAWVRQNVGYDFAAWAHAWSRCGDLSGCARLLLVNDSIVGPLDGAAFDAMLARLRASPADLVGLTGCAGPLPHLQSFFLSLGPRALAAPACGEFFAQVRSLPEKQLVIDAYEVTLTQRLVGAGLSAAPLFEPQGEDPRSQDDTTARWEALLDAGFPFVKGSVLRSTRGGALARRRVPRHLWPAGR